jgi:hypothetical protein
MKKGEQEERGKERGER